MEIKWPELRLREIRNKFNSYVYVGTPRSYIKAIEGFLYEIYGAKLYDLLSLTYNENEKERVDPFIRKHLSKDKYDSDEANINKNVCLSSSISGYYYYLDIAYLPTVRNILKENTKFEDIHYNDVIRFNIIGEKHLDVCIGHEFCLVACNGDNFLYITDKYHIPKDLQKMIVFEKKEKVKPKLYFIDKIMQNGTISVDSFNIIDTSWKKIKENYNDDLPDDRIMAFLKDNRKSGIILLSGLPGTGKTYYIRSLVKRLKKKIFIYITINDFLALCQMKKNLVNLGTDTIFVIEDCDCLLEKRENSQFSQISSILNITDGMFGDNMNLKIICTINTNTADIDQAVVRRGRTAVIYKFNKLSAEKSRELCEEHHTKFEGGPMVLSDIYNSEDPIANKKKEKGMGFC